MRTTYVVYHCHRSGVKGRELVRMPNVMRGFTPSGLSSSLDRLLPLLPAYLLDHNEYRQLKEMATKVLPACRLQAAVNIRYRDHFCTCFPGGS